MMLRSRKIILVALCALLASGLSMAQDGSETEAESQWTESQQKAWDRLQAMATQLSEAPRFQVSMRVGFDVLQANGQKIEFGEQRKLSVERPSLFLNEALDSDGKGETILFDGEWITVSDADAKVYARAPQPGDIDATVKYFVRDLGMRLPLAAMLTSHFPQELEARVIDIAYVEETDILGAPAHHIAGRIRDVDFQAWISTGPNALPLRIILTYREAPGQPQFWANFSDWKFNPSFMRNAFTFVAPAGAQEVPLVAQFTPDSQGNDDPADAVSSSAAGETP